TVLPALIDQTLAGAAAIFDEAVAVAIAEALDPIERRRDMRPDLADERDIAGPFETSAGEHDEKRRRIDAAVIFAERHFAKRRHFAVPDLVKNLAGLGVRPGIDLRRLIGGE